MKNKKRVLIILLILIVIVLLILGTVLVWNGKRCEDTPATEEEIKEMEELLKEYR